MGIVELLLKLALVGGTWILYLLILLSIIAVGVMLERWWFFRNIEKEAQSQELVKFERLLIDGNINDSVEKLKNFESPVFKSLYLGLMNINRGSVVVEQIAESSYIAERDDLEKGLTFLGTLGNNAPFIGLLGTVLGIIKAFADLAQSQSSGPQVVMVGISEALVATAVGLLLAIPCVIFFNFYMKKLKKLDNIFNRYIKLIKSAME